MPQKIYFDESGFTGANLLNPDQPFFVYGSVATSDEEARDFVNYLIDKYNIQTPELKGRLLVRYGNGRKAISEIFEKFEGRVKVSVSDKKYALACKYFEYIFEPCIAEQSTVFYQIGFHQFIATYLYLALKAQADSAEDLFSKFENCMRNPTEDTLIEAVRPKPGFFMSTTTSQILDFALCNIDEIRDEILSIPGEGPDKWTLDITSTSLHTLLASWGQQYEHLTAICDQSKPLLDQRGIFEAMIGREECQYTHIFGDPRPLTFNLSGPVQLVDSRHVHGVQLADAISAAVVFAVSNKESNSVAKRWCGFLPHIADLGCMPGVNYKSLQRQLEFPTRWQA